MQLRESNESADVGYYDEMKVWTYQVVKNVATTAREVAGVLRGRAFVAAIALAVIVLLLEVAQSWPEAFPGGHVLSVFFRAIIYSVIAALIFNLVVVEVPRRRRARVVYEYNRNNLEILIAFGPANILTYGLGKNGDYNPWNIEDVCRNAKHIAKHQPSFFGPDRRNQMRLMIHGIHEALSEIRFAQSFLSLEVSQAIAMFPAANGMNQLQVDELPDGSISWERDVHINWSATVASRRLYQALKREFPDLEFSRGEVVLQSGETFTVPEEMLTENVSRSRQKRMVWADLRKRFL